MSLAYPLAASADDALTGANAAARTRYDAEELSEDRAILSLETEWLKPAASDVSALLKQAESGEAKGFIQVYEDADGSPVLAVTYWKLGPSQARAKAEARAKKAAEARVKARLAAQAKSDARSKKAAEAEAKSV